VAKFGLLSAVIFSSAMLFVGPALAAQDVKIYAGSQCEPLSPDQPLGKDGTGRITNLSANDESFLCPAVREVEKGSIGSASVILYGNKASECDLLSKSETGAKVGRGRPTEEIKLAKHRRKLLYGTGAGNTIPVSAGGYFYFVCSIAGGGQSGIISYRITEVDDR
jgi:hypothetical protein